MNEQTHVETHAFEVEDEHGNRSVAVQTKPVKEDERGDRRTVPLGMDLRLRTGEALMALSDTEFKTADGTKWRRTE